MKKSEQPSLQQLDFSDHLADHPAVQWIYDNGKLIGYGTLALIAILLIGYRFNTYSLSKAEHDYIEAENAWSALAEAPLDSDQQADISRLKQLMSKHSDLAIKYDALLAQYLIYKNDSTQALPLANTALKRTAKENHPFYTPYAETTLLIGQGENSKALAQTLELDEKMKSQLDTEESKREFGNTLYFYNLLRMAALQQQLSLKNDEINTWNAVERFLSHSSWDANEKAAVMQILQEGNLDLSDYINYRRKLINRKGN